MAIGNIHVHSMETSTRLSSYYVETAISPFDVIEVLNDAGVSFVLTGAHGIGGWLRDPRTTQDVDLVVAAKHLKKATRVLLKAFPNLEPENLNVVIRLRDKESKDVVIDLMKPVQTLYRETFKHVHTVSFKGHRYRIPTLEMCLAMKFAAMISPNRAEEKIHIDAHDFILMIKQNKDIDLNSLSQLGELVFGGGGKRITDLVSDVREGRKLIL